MHAIGQRREYLGTRMYGVEYAPFFESINAMERRGFQTVVRTNFLTDSYDGSSYPPSLISPRMMRLGRLYPDKFVRQN
jgi:hypothetical protein